MNFPRFAAPRADAIFAYEYLYQVRFFSGLLKRPGLLRALARWMRRAYTGMALVLAGFVVLYPAVHLILGLDSSLSGVYGEDFGITVLIWLLGVLPALILIPHVLVTHFSVLFRAIARGANSVTREKQSGTWDLLLLTGVTTRQIVNGKWWATLRSMLPQAIVLGLLRSAVIIWLVVDSGRVFGAALSWSGYSVSAALEIAPYSEAFDFFDMLIVPLQILPLTLLTVAFAAACGVLASTLTARVTVGIMLAMFLRFAIIVGLVLGGIYLYTQTVRLLWSNNVYVGSSPWDTRYVVENTLAISAVTAIDNGTVITTNLLNYLTTPNYRNFSYDQFVQLFSITALASQVLVYGAGVLLTRGVLAVAWWSGKRQGALPIPIRRRRPATEAVNPPLAADSPPR